MYRSRSARPTAPRIGALLALALLAACGTGASGPSEPGARVENSPALAPLRPAIALDAPSEEREPREPSASVGGGADAATPPQGSQPASAAVPDEPTTAPLAEGASSGRLPPAASLDDPQQAWASTSGATVSAPTNAALSALQPTAAAPRRVSEAEPPAVTARYVAVLDEASGELLYGQDERARVAMASVTKIATTLVALERELDLGVRVPVTISGSAMAARDHSSIMGLEPGREVSLMTLLYGMMLPSGNDAAEQVALALGGSREEYLGWMNQKVAELGLQDTHFVNPSGMDAADHYSSAYDMALLGRFAMQNETFRRLAGATTYRGDGYTMSNLNRLLGAYPGADGIKIGLTRAAGRTIVASASRDGHRVYVSLMRSRDLPGDSRLLYDWVWRTFEW